MKITLIEILEKLRAEPTLVIQLYEELYNSEFFVMIVPGTDHNVEQMEFITYSTEDGTRELPIYTANQFILTFPDIQTVTIKITGHLLWPRLMRVLETMKCEVAVNPGQKYGIRLTKSMILGMISTYGSESI